jgi:hypothetical protein
MTMTQQLVQKAWEGPWLTEPQTATQKLLQQMQQKLAAVQLNSSKASQQQQQQGQGSSPAVIWMIQCLGA